MTDRAPSTANPPPAAAVAAHVWRSGLIEFRSNDAPLPKGAIGLPHAPRETYESLTRHGWDGQLIVPGLPEADSDRARLDALTEFVRRIETADSGRDPEPATAQAAGNKATQNADRQAPDPQFHVPVTFTATEFYRGYVKVSAPNPAAAAARVEASPDDFEIDDWGKHLETGDITGVALDNTSEVIPLD